MAKNLTNRVTLVTVNVGGLVKDTEKYIFTTKEAMEQKLFAIAVENWNVESDMPSSRKRCIEEFFNGDMNYYTCETVLQVSSEAAKRAAMTARDSIISTLGKETRRTPKKAKSVG